MTNSVASIDTFVVLMLENRSFDHMLGFMKSATYPIEGLTGSETNPLQPQGPSELLVYVSKDAHSHGDLDDPGHSLNPAVIRQLYGLTDGQIEQLTEYPASEPLNNGFLYDYSQLATGTGTTDEPAVVPLNIMKCFDPATLPTLTGLARDFAICDHWFSSVPGPTLPNRWFVHCGTSGGYVGGSLALSALTTVQELLAMHGHSWKIYYGDIPHALTLTRLWSAQSIVNFAPGDAFLEDAATGQLPNYSFIEPAYFNPGANDAHPPHDVHDAEKLVASIYHALKNSPQWASSMLIILFDEHGGTYDHVPPPETVSPDGLAGYDDDNGHYLAFHFDRLGARVPAIVISPLIPAGTIDSTGYDHTSILKMLENRFGLPSLSQRDAAAADPSQVASLTSPRTDSPSVGVIPPGREAAIEDATDRPLSDLQRELLRLAVLLPAAEPAGTEFIATSLPEDVSESAAGAYVRAKVSAFLAAGGTISR